MKRIAFLVAMLIGHSNSAHALLPESGFYWNPALPGMGFSVEFQDDFMFLASYTYADNGSAVFFTIQGLLNVSTGRVSGSLSLFDGGTCIGCPFSAPVATEIAPAEVQFIDNRTGTIRVFFPQGVAEVPITRFVFFLDDGSPEGELLGSWSSVSGDFGLFDGEMLGFLSKAPPPEGFDRAFTGNRLASNRALVGARLSGTNTWIVLLDSSTSFWRRWIFTSPTPNRWIGLHVVYDKSDPTPAATAGVPSFTHRLTGRRTIDQITDGASELEKRTDGFQDMIDAQIYRRHRELATEVKSLFPNDLEMAEIVAIDSELLDNATLQIQRMLTLVQRTR